MSIETPTANESPVTEADSTTDAIKTFVASVTDVLNELGADEKAVVTVEVTGEQLVGRVREDREQRDSERDSMAHQVADVRGDLHDAREAVESHDNAETEAVEADSPDANPGVVQQSPPFRPAASS